MQNTNTKQTYTLFALRLGRPDSGAAAAVPADDAEEAADVYTFGGGIDFRRGTGAGRVVVVVAVIAGAGAEAAADAETSLSEEVFESFTLRGVARRDLRSFGSMPTGSTSRGASLGDGTAVVGAVEVVAEVEVEGFLSLLVRAAGFGAGFCADFCSDFSSGFWVGADSCSFCTESGRSDAGFRRPFPGVPLAVPRPRTRRTLGVVLALVSLVARDFLVAVTGRLSSSGVASDSASARRLAMVSACSW